jgi:ADP-ribose pyrophosphatase
MPPSLPLPAHEAVEVDSSQRVWQGRTALDVIRFRHRRFDGAMSGTKTWEVWRRGHAVAMLPYDPEADTLVLIEQFRLPALAAGMDPVLVEIPAGFRDDGETVEQTIHRESLEEMGLEADRLEHIGDFLLTAGGSDEVCTIFAGRVRAPATGPDGIVGLGGLASEHEDIRIRVWPAERAIEAALDGQLPNSVTALALLWFASRRERLRQMWMGS